MSSELFGRWRQRVGATPGDRVGVIASALCLIHCIAAPVFLLAAPVFGHWWSSPLAHFMMALFVVPLSIGMMSRGFRRLRRVRLIASGTGGILLICAGAMAPFVQTHAHAAPGETVEAPAAGLEGHDGGIGPAEEPVACTKSCCPTVVPSDSGEFKVQAPLASGLTTAGGLLLILMHLWNMCLCPQCRSDKSVCSGRAN